MRAFSGVDRAELASFFAYNPAFAGGVSVAAGDVNGDGVADIITGAGAGGGPHVRAFSGADRSELASFFAYNPAFTGGVSVAAGDVNGDGLADIITGAGAGGGPHVRVFSGADRSELLGFFAYSPLFTGGVSVAAGDVNGDGLADIITGAGAGGGPHVRAFSGDDRSELASFFAYNPAFAGGASVGAGDVNDDGLADIITGAGPGGGPHVRAFSGADRSELASFFAYSPAFTGGVHVSGVSLPGDLIPPAIAAALANDTGFDFEDGLTWDASVVGIAVDENGIASLRAGFDATLPANFLDVSADVQSDGTFAFGPARLNQINGAALSDGAHTLHLQAIDPRGNVSSFDLPFTLDTTAPSSPIFDLALAFDTGVLGDQQTDLATVSLAGTTEAGAFIEVLQTGNTTTAEPSGGLLQANVALRLGANPLTLRATDAAGNRSTFSRTFTRGAAAETLNERALRIYESVLNTIEYVPYPGSQKGARATAETLAGNDWDQATLLIERLFDAGITARYVSGRIALPFGIVNAWLGILDSFSFAALERGGLNPVFDETSGVFTFDHTWVEAQLTLPGSGVTWAPLDPSFKIKDRQAGIQGLLNLVPFDEAGYLSQARTELAYEFYERQVSAWLRANRPGMSLADVPYDGPIVEIHYAAVPTSLPYTIVGTPSTFMDVPEMMTQRARLTLNNGTPLWSQAFVLPEMSLERVTISFAEAGPGQVLPELRLAGQVIATGSAVSIGTPLSLDIESLEPGDDMVDRTRSASVTAGNYVAVGLDVNQFSPASLARLQEVVNRSAIDVINGLPAVQDERIGALLALAISRWFCESERQDRILEGLCGRIEAYRTLEFGITTSETSVSFHSDLPIPYIPRAAVIDIASSAYNGIPISAASLTPAAVRLSDMNGSALEHALWEELLNTESISTVKSLQLAADRGIPVFVINSANQAELMPLLTLSPSDRFAIQNLVNGGATVTTPRDPTPLNQYQGVGYISDGPGGVGYFISGGLNGGATTGNARPAPNVPKGTANRNQFCVSDPINIANGNVLHEQTDIELPGIGLPLIFARHYDSQVATDRGMGAGWIYSYADYLSFEPGGAVTWNTAEGYRFTFTQSAGGGFITPDSLHGTFTAIDGGGFQYRDKTGLTYRFDALRRLTQQLDRNGNAVDIAHVGDTREIATVTDADAPSRQLTFTYSGGLLTQVSDFTGRSWTYAYTGGRLSQVTGPADAQTVPFSVQYDYFTDTARNGLLRQITKADGGTVEFGYYPNRQAFRETDPLGNSVMLTYNPYRQQTTYFDERGNPEVYEYNQAGNLVAIVAPDRARQEFIWVNGLQTSATDAFGIRETFEYDALGNLTRQVDRNEVESLFTYEPVFSNVTSVTRSGGRVTRFDYDANGNLVRVLDPMGNTTTFTHDARGLVLTLTEPEGNTTVQAGDHTKTFTYNDAGQVLSLATDLPSLERFVYDARGNLESIVNANDHTTSFGYDVRDRLITVTDALDGVSRLRYDVMNNLTQTTDELLRTTNFAYDRRQRLTQTINADQTVFTYVYDAAANLIRQTDELGRNSWFQFDANDRQVATYLPDGTVSPTEYDGAGRVVGARDGEGVETRFEYDRVDRLLATIDARGGRTTQQYDAVGNVLSVTDPLGHGTAVTYDLLDRPTTLTDAVGGVTRFAYDYHDITSVTDAVGNITSYEYDVARRLTSETNALGSRTFQYDPAGNPTRFTDRNGRVTTYSYDNLERRAAERWLDVAGNPFHVFSYNYDEAGQLKTAVDADSALSYDTMCGAAPRRSPMRAPPTCPPLS